MKVSIIVLNWNGEKYISACLKKLKELKTAGATVETVVVDNQSTDNSVALIRKSFSNVTLIENSQNIGYSGGNNVGIQYALDNNADFVWVVNPDIEVDKNALEPLLDAFSKYPRAGILGSKVYFAPGYEFHPERYTKSQLGKVLWYAGGKIDWANMVAQHKGVDEVDAGQFDDLSETEFVTGASMMVRREVFADTGLLDEKYFLYFEENDFCQRAKRKWDLLYVPESRVWHANAQATGIGSPLQDYFITRNRLLFGMRYAPLRTKLALIRESLRFLFSGRPDQKKGVMDFYTSNFGKGSYDFSNNNH